MAWANHSEPQSQPMVDSQSNTEHQRAGLTELTWSQSQPSLIEGPSWCNEVEDEDRLDKMWPREVHSWGLPNHDYTASEWGEWVTWGPPDTPWKIRAHQGTTQYIKAHQGHTTAHQGTPAHIWGT